MRYQQIELMLKLGFRQMSFTPGGSAQLPTVVLHGSTLGSLFAEVRKRAGFDQESGEAMRATFDQVLVDRNHLIHSFLQTRQARLATNAGVRELIAELDEQHARCDIVLRIAEGCSAVSMLDLVENGRLSDEERSSLRSSLESALKRIGVEVVRPEANPAKGVLAGVVELLRRTEREHGDPESGTRLSTAGDVIAQHFAGLEYRQLGYDNLSSLAKGEGFETWVQNGAGTGAQVVRYRTVRPMTL
jgi:hypothetical protein